MTYKITSISNWIIVALTLIIFAFLALIVIVELCKMIRSHKKFRSNILEYVILSIFSFVLSYIFFISSIATFQQVKGYVVPYSNGEYQTVSGKIVNYIEDKHLRSIEFSVNDVDFFFGTDFLYLGINSPKIFSENEEVTIKYIYAENYFDGSGEKQNVILEIQKDNAGT